MCELSPSTVSLAVVYPEVLNFLKHVDVHITRPTRALNLRNLVELAVDWLTVSNASAIAAGS